MEISLYHSGTDSAHLSYVLIKTELGEAFYCTGLPELDDGEYYRTGCEKFIFDEEE